jgi:hypothetical protein
VGARVETLERTSIQGRCGNRSRRLFRIRSCASRELLSPARPVGSRTKITAEGRCYEA